MATGNEYNTLRDLLKAIADAIRSKVGDVGLISAQDFPANINAIKTASDVEIEATKSVVPSFEAQTIAPSTGFEAMAQVNVGAISVTQTLNSASGYTVMVG